MMNSEVYFHKSINFKHEGKKLLFRTSQSLFSSFQVDVGTRFLLRTITATNLNAHCKILDLGCGYGPIGLTLKKIYSDSVVHMVDRDALAIEYSRQNAELNQMSDVKVYGSLGYDNVQETDFDLIISNIPAKAGELVISYFLRDAAHYLSLKGLVAIVVVAPLEMLLEKIVSNEPYITILYKRRRAGHVVFHFQYSNDHDEEVKPGLSAIERGIYDRDNVAMSFHGLRYRMQMAQGLPEFNSLHYHNEILMEEIRVIQRAGVGRAIVFNPGQGHIPVMLWKLLEPNRIILVDRDLLSLEYSKKNLMINECPDRYIMTSHQVGIYTKDEEQADLIMGAIREDEGTEAIALTIKQAAAQLSHDGTILISATSTVITRLIKVIQSQNLLKIRKRKRWRGYSLLMLKHNLP